MNLIPPDSKETESRNGGAITQVDRRWVLTLGVAAGAELLQKANAETPAINKRTAGHNPVLGTGGVHHTTVRTRDWDGTLKFYQQVLGFSVKLAWNEVAGTMDERLAGAGRSSQRWAYLDSGDGTYIEVFEDQTFVPPAADTTDPVKNAGSPIVHFGVRTSRIEQVCKNAKAHGVVVVGDPVDYTMNTTTGQGPVVMRLCFIQGPSGEWIELVQNAP